MTENTEAVAEQDESLDDFDLDTLMAAPVSSSTTTEVPKRKRRKFRKYPRPPELTPAQKKELLEAQGGVCPICREELTLEDAVCDHSYRVGTVRGLLHRSPCNTGLGMFKDSPTRLKNALAYLKSPPGKALGLCDRERDTPTRGARAKLKGANDDD